MLAQLDTQHRLTVNQLKLISVAVLADMLGFFSYFLVGFVLGFIVQAWGLTYWESTFILLTSGIGAIAGAFFGWAADRWGRRPIFIIAVLTFSIGSGVLALTPERNWVWLALFRFAVGFGVGGIYSVSLPLVQEFVPARMRGAVVGLVTASIPVGMLLGSVVSASLAPLIGWRGLFAIALLPSLLPLLTRAWVPESPQWLAIHGRPDDTRKSIAWALMIDLKNVQMPATLGAKLPKAGWREIFSYRRSWAVSWLTNLGMQVEYYGLTMWAPTLIALLMGVTPQVAAFYCIFVSLSGICGRVFFAFMSEMIGRRTGGIVVASCACVMTLVTGIFANSYLGGVEMYLVLLMITMFFVDGGFAIVGPYASEVWPAALRSSGLGSSYGFGGIGKILGPMGLALVVGASSNLLSPEASREIILPAYIYFACFGALAALAYAIFGFETMGKTLEEVESYLASSNGRGLGASSGHDVVGR